MVVFMLMMVGLSVDFLASVMALAMASKSLKSALAGIFNSLVTLLDVKHVPAVRLVAHLDVLGE